MAGLRHDVVVLTEYYGRRPPWRRRSEGLQTIKAHVEAGKLKGQDAISARVGRIINRYKVAKHFELHITDASLAWDRKADRVRAHIFLCMLAYYVEWHMREAWRKLTFADTELQDKVSRDPVAPAKRSD